MFVKLEAANPGGSVKDRMAIGIIDERFHGRDHASSHAGGPISVAGGHEP
jgi:hypothetical protein